MSRNHVSHEQNFVLLDGLRGLGAILVLYGHSISLWGGYSPPIGAVMVDLFFLLSGFVIAYAYEPKLRAGMSAVEFMQHRIIRLYPLYLLGAVLGFVFMAALAVRDGGSKLSLVVQQFVPTLVGLPSPPMGGVTTAYPLNPPAWTLGFELVVNLVYVLFFRWLRDTRVLVAVTVVFAVVLTVMVVHYGQIHIGMDWRNIVGGFGRAGFGFFAGVLAFRLVGSPTRASRPPSNWAFVILIAIPAICLAPIAAEVRMYTELLVVIGLGVPIIWISRLIEPPSRYAGIFLVGGRISYALYILHLPFVEVFRHEQWRFYKLGIAPPLPGIILLVMMLVIAVLAERYYDRPVRRAIVGLIKQGRTRKRLVRELAKSASTAD
jgi:peptidoglycan/LPS O-acetylase OafA/YrhL